MEEEGADFHCPVGLLGLSSGGTGEAVEGDLPASGIELDEAGTRAAVEFTRTGSSGRSAIPPWGYPPDQGIRPVLEVPSRLEKDQDQDGAREPGEKREEVLVLPIPVQVRVRSRWVGKCFEALWGIEEPEDCHDLVEIPLSEVVFPSPSQGVGAGGPDPSSLRDEEAEEALRRGQGSPSERSRIPVLSDAEGRILWVAGLASSTLFSPERGPRYFFLGFGMSTQS